MAKVRKCYAFHAQSVDVGDCYGYNEFSDSLGEALMWRAQAESNGFKCSRVQLVREDRDPKPWYITPTAPTF